MKRLLLIMLFIATQKVTYAQICNITNISPINFGNYDVANITPTDGLGYLTISCDKNTDVIIQLDRGLYANTFSTRFMKHSYLNDMLAYNIFTDISRTTIWGDGSGGSRTVTLKVKKNRPETTTLYGRIFASQNVSIGNYSDTITITVLP